jgi:hypothetical protein
LQFPHEKDTTMNIRGELLLSLQNKVLYSKHVISLTNQVTVTVKSVLYDFFCIYIM